MAEFFELSIWQWTLFSVPLYEWLFALGLLFLIWIGAIAFELLIKVIVRAILRRRDQPYENSLHERFSGPLVSLLTMFGLYFILVQVPVVGFLTIWRWYIFLAILGGLVIWTVLRLFNGVIRRNSFFDIQKYLVTQGTLVAYLVVVGLVLGTLLIQWPIWCVPNCNGVRLNNADLSGLPLATTSFIQADLTNVDLSGADLSETDLSGVRMFNVNLQGADLTGATLVGANLQRADLRGAILEDADFRGADLRQAVLTRQDLTVVREVGGARLVNAVMVEVNLTNAELRGADLTNAILTGAILQDAVLTGARLSGADLRGANLQGADLSGAFMNDTNLGNANLEEASIAGVSMVGSQLAGVNLRHAIMDGALLVGANLSGADLRGTEMIGIQIFPAEFQDRTVLRLDSVLASKNELQLAQIITVADLGGIITDEETVWPSDKRTLLSDRLGVEIPIPEGEVIAVSEQPRSLRLASTRYDRLAPICCIDVDPVLFEAATAVVESFQAEGYQFEIAVNPVEADTSFQQFCQVAIDMNVTTRLITAEEEEACRENGIDPYAVRVGTRETLVVIVNPLNTYLNNLTITDLQEALTLNRWSEVNPLFPATDIDAFVPEPGSSAFELLVDVVFDGNEQPLLSSQTVAFEPSEANLVWNLANDVDAIGIISYDYFQANTSIVRPVPINEVTVTLANIEGPNYPLIRPVVLYVDLNWNRLQYNVNLFTAFFLDQSQKLFAETDIRPLTSASVDNTLQAYLLTVGGTLDQ